MAKRLTSDEREARDELLLAALDALSCGTEWVDADQLVRHLHGARPGEREQVSATGAGRILARLASEGRCEVRDEGYMNRYRGRDARQPVPGVGELLVPKDTPAGPWLARVAWADAVGSLRTVLGVERDGLDVAYGQKGRAGSRVTSVEELGETYERPDGKPVGRDA